MNDVFESERYKEQVRDDLESALRAAKALSGTDDIESPSYDYCDRLIKAIRDAIDLL